MNKKNIRYYDLDFLRFLATISVQGLIRGEYNVK